MGAIITTLVNFGTKFFPFLSTIGIWFNKFTSFISVFFTLNILIKLKYIALALPLISLVVLAFTLFISAIMGLYNAINTFLASINSLMSSADSITSCVFYILNIMGFVDGFKSALPLFFSFLGYYLIRLLFANALKFYSFILEFLNNLTLSK